MYWSTKESPWMGSKLSRWPTTVFVNINSGTCLMGAEGAKEKKKVVRQLVCPLRAGLESVDGLK
ncbi:UNVERIFIED_CONTAM: hypothetical protein FKN15_071182 [Acipenser sinensis]